MVEVGFGSYGQGEAGEKRDVVATVFRTRIVS